MRLLITTQAVDLDDPILGFFHRWIVEVAKHFDQVIVICLREGRHDLPANVSVHSLGKERSVSRVAYVWNFYRYIWTYRHDYDAVFVHMNQEYVLLGWKLWWLMGKRMYMWRNHYAGNVLTRLAVALCTKVFCTSRHSYTARFKKTVLMPVGIDTETFKPIIGVMRKAHSILSLGRIAPSKNIHVLIEALQLLRQKGVGFTCDIYGGALSADVGYMSDLKKKTAAAGLDDAVVFRGATRNSDAPSIYSAHAIFVNLSRSGMFDKTLFEAAACGCDVLATSDDFSKNAGLAHAFDGTAPHLAERLVEIFSSTPTDLRPLAEQQSLAMLGNRLARECTI